MKPLFKRIATLAAPILSRRLIMAVLALYMLRNAFWGIVTGLYTFSDAAHISAYQALAIAYLSAVVGVAMWYIGNTTWKGGLTVASSLQTMLSSESRDEHVVTEEVNVQIIKDMSERYKDDPSYRPIQPDTEEQFR